MKGKILKVISGVFLLIITAISAHAQLKFDKEGKLENEGLPAKIPKNSKVSLARAVPKDSLSDADKKAIKKDLLRMVELNLSSNKASAIDMEISVVALFS
jgi:hypothetical protein